MAPRGLRSFRNRPVNSSAKCAASHNDPPFPQINTFRPPRYAATITSTKPATAERSPGSQQTAPAPAEPPQTHSPAATSCPCPQSRESQRLPHPSPAESLKHARHHSGALAPGTLNRLTGCPARYEFAGSSSGLPLFSRSCWLRLGSQAVGIRCSGVITLTAHHRYADRPAFLFAWIGVV